MSERSTKINNNNNDIIKNFLATIYSIMFLSDLLAQDRVLSRIKGGCFSAKPVVVVMSEEVLMRDL